MGDQKTNDIDFVRKQLAEVEEKLQLIQDRKSRYVLETDIPLQLGKDERQLKARVADLQARMGQGTGSLEPGQVKSERKESSIEKWKYIIVLLVVAIIAACAVIAVPLIEREIPPVTPSPTVTFTPHHRLQVQDLETRQAVENAVVSVRAVGAAGASIVTDGNGHAEINVGSSDIVELVISADGYESGEWYIDLTQDTFPQVIFLKRLSELDETLFPSPPPTDATATSLPASASPTSLAPTFTPTPTTPPPTPPSTYTPASPPSPLSIRDLWATGAVCDTGSLWSADLWVQPEGGDGTYTYYIDGNWQAGPTTEGVTIRISRAACIAIVGTMTVESGGQIESREFYIDVPDCCE